MRDDMVLKDVNGVIHAITRRNIGWMLGAGWLFYFASFILNIIYYIIHPSFADISGPALMRRLTCGQEEGLGIETEMEKELDVESRHQSTLDLGTLPDEEIPLLKMAKERFCTFLFDHNWLLNHFLGMGMMRMFPNGKKKKKEFFHSLWRKKEKYKLFFC